MYFLLAGIACTSPPAGEPRQSRVWFGENTGGLLGISIDGATTPFGNSIVAAQPSRGDGSGRTTPGGVLVWNGPGSTPVQVELSLDFDVAGESAKFVGDVNGDGEDELAISSRTDGIVLFKEADIDVDRTFDSRVGWIHPIDAFQIDGLAVPGDLTGNGFADLGVLGASATGILSGPVTNDSSELLVLNYLAIQTVSDGRVVASPVGDTDVSVVLASPHQILSGVFDDSVVEFSEPVPTFGSVLAVDRDVSAVAVGAPRADEGRGAVFVYAPPSSEPLLELWGEQPRGGLGSSLAFGDLDGNGVLDLAIGQPGTPGGNSGEPGGVILILDVLSHYRNATSTLIQGPADGSDFGRSIVFEDLTHDGIEELWVGAPLLGPYSEGAIFTYEWAGEPAGDGPAAQWVEL